MVHPRVSPQISLWEEIFAASFLGAHFSPFCQEECQELPKAPLTRRIGWPNEEDLRIILIINQQPGSRQPWRGEISAPAAAAVASLSRTDEGRIKTRLLQETKGSPGIPRGHLQIKSFGER